MQKNLNNLIKRTETLVKQKNISDFCITNEELVHISETLKVCLPEDFIEINLQISYIGFSAIEFFMVYEGQNDIVESNQYIRKSYAIDSAGKSDMSHILVLADDDGGSVFMITQDSPEKPTPVIWCDYGDMYYYSIHGKFQNPHDEWPSFTAFFEYLVEQAEEELEED